jgi:uncharacterized membrane protein
MKYKKTIYGTLLVSLAANLFFAGMVTVFLIKGPPTDRFGSADRFNMIAAQEVLDPAQQETVEDIWANFRRDQRGDFRSVFKMRRQIQEILQADEFDEAAFAEKFSKMQETGMEARLAITQVLREISLALSPDQRKKYFQAGMDPNNRRGPGDKEGRRRPPPPEEE